MKKLALYFLVSTAIIFLPVVKSPPVPPVNTEVEIRVKNATPWIFYDCTVNAYNYGSVNIDAVSAYKTFAKAYRYASIALSMNGKPYSIIPIDNVGETSLANGKYTYKLTYSATDDRLNMELIKD